MMTKKTPGDVMLAQSSTARFLASQAMRPSLLIVEDECMICDLLSLALEEDYQVTCVGTREDALRVLAGQIIDVMLLDYHLPGGGAVEVARRADEAGIPMAWMTGDHIVSETSSHRVLLKPFHLEQASEVLTELRNPACLLTGRPGQLVTGPPAVELEAARVLP
jgi:CheY-like chemotaxis protein